MNSLTLSSQNASFSSLNDGGTFPLCLRHFIEVYKGHALGNETSDFDFIMYHSIFLPSVVAIAQFVAKVSGAHVYYPRQIAPSVLPAQACQETSISNFTLRAVYKDTPDSAILIKTIDVNTVPHVGYAILSGCTTCGSSWSFYTLQDGALLPKSTTSPMLRTVSFSLVEGESPSFISTQFPPPPYSGYCLMKNTAEPSESLVFAANIHSDLWSLCPNTTAGGRIDVVYAAKDNHAHYTKTNCREVYLEQV